MLRFLLSAVVLVSVGLLAPQRPGSDAPVDARWTVERVNAWYGAQPWLVGCNFIPSTAVNQLEMWQADTFDPATIDRELQWASGLGMNAVRVFLHDLAWEADAEGFKKRIETFLGIAQKRGIRTMFVLFDDCWNETPKIGRQPDPVRGVHNSGWLQSPGKSCVNAPESWPRLQRYVQDIVGTFASDRRILAWDVYNEPGNSGQDDRSLPLLKKVFEWARAAKPDQPLTAGIWCGRPALNEFQLAQSDFVSFHNYDGPDALRSQIEALQKHGRPVVCTEWLRRGNSEVAACLPVFKQAHVGCFNWGLVAGKTQTIYPWGAAKDSPEPKRWFHDLLRKDGTPFDAAEVASFRELTRAQ